MALSTVNDIITLAFQSVSIVRVGQSPSGEYTTYALDILNEMLDKWTSDGIPHGLDTVTTATEVYDGSLISAVRKNLAVTLAAGPFPADLHPLLAKEAFDEKSNLVSFDEESEYDTSLRVRNIDSLRFDISTP